MAQVATSPASLLSLLVPSAHLDADRLVIDDEAAFRGAGIRDLAWTAAFSTDEATTAAAQWLVWEASQVLGARSASIQGLYEARARGEVNGFTVPAINIRAQTFDMARTVFEAAEAADVGAVILELARSEQTYTYQRPIDYATSVLAGAIAANWQHPVFIQGDHYQFNAKKYADDPEKMTEEIRRACRLAIDAVRSPVLAERYLGMTDYLRFETSLPHRLNELAILIEARLWDAQYEWWAHYPIAMRAGVSPEVAEAIRNGLRPSGMKEDEEIVYDVCIELLRDRNLTDATFARANKVLGEQPTIDLVAVAGFYVMVSSVLIAGRVGIPDGSPPPLPVLVKK